MSTQLNLPYEKFWLGLLARPELALIKESCRDERRLHAALSLKPLRPVKPAEIANIRDENTRGNYAMLLQFRDGVLAAGSLPAWYAQLFSAGPVTLPPLFIDYAVEHILATLLEGQDSLTRRASELLYRQQRVALHEGRILSGDRDTLDEQNDTGGLGDIGRLLLQNKITVVGGDTQTLKVLTRGSADDFLNASSQPHYRHNWLLYLTHEEASQVGTGHHSFEIRLARSDSGLSALARVVELWIMHFKGCEVRVTPVARVEDAAWRWHTGLDSESTQILNALYQQKEVTPSQLQRLISLFRLDFINQADCLPDMQGKPTYLGLAMSEQGLLKLKPQNLLLNLPWAISN